MLLTILHNFMPMPFLENIKNKESSFVELYDDKLFTDNKLNFVEIYDDAKLILDKKKKSIASRTMILTTNFALTTASIGKSKILKIVWL